VARAHRDELERAKARLDRLHFYPRPVRIERVRVFHWPWFFRLPYLRRFDGFAAWGTIFMRELPLDEGLLTHELCHVWQLQHRPLMQPLSYLRGYANNRYEVEARRAVDETRD
jgi:hypothetical protein